MVPVGDPNQLPPTVLSRLANELGLCVSIFGRMFHALRGQESSVVHLSICYRMHPQLLAFPNAAYYRKGMKSGILDPLRERPIVEGIPWRDIRVWEPERLAKLATLTGSDESDLRATLEPLDPPLSPDKHRFLMVHAPSWEVTSELQPGFANLPEAAQAVDIVLALLPELHKGTTARIVVGYQLQTAILMDGWPQGPRHLSGVLRNTRGGTKGSPARGKTDLDGVDRTHLALDNPLKATGWTLSAGNKCSERTIMPTLPSAPTSLDYDRLRASI